MEAKWTPGPWALCKDIGAGNSDPANRLYVWPWANDGEAPPPHDKAVCTVHSGAGGDMEANARLIAASPALYQALIDARNVIATSAHFHGAQDQSDAAATLADIDAALALASATPKAVRA